MQELEKLGWGGGFGVEGGGGRVDENPKKKIKNLLQIFENFWFFYAIFHLNVFVYE